VGVGRALPTPASLVVDGALDDGVVALAAPASIVADEPISALSDAPVIPRPAKPRPRAEIVAARSRPGGPPQMPRRGLAH